MGAIESQRSQGSDKNVGLLPNSLLEPWDLARKSKIQNPKWSDRSTALTYNLGNDSSDEKSWHPSLLLTS